MFLYCIIHLQFLVLTHSVPQVIISKAKIAKVTCLFQMYSNSNLPIVVSLQTNITHKMLPHISQVRNRSVVEEVRGYQSCNVADLKLCVGSREDDAERYECDLNQF